MASSLRVCLLRAISEVERPPSGVLWEEALLEGDEAVVRFMVGVPTVEPALDFW